jgi:hypothetical protein
LAFDLKYAPEAASQYKTLSESKALKKQYKAVRKALCLLGNDPAHPSLKTHKYNSIQGPDKAEVFEAYAENKTPAAWRIFWCYYPAKTKTITILAIRPHP